MFLSFSTGSILSQVSGSEFCFFLIVRIYEEELPSWGVARGDGGMVLVKTIKQKQGTAS